MSSSSRDPIAIVGIGCRFPQADGPAAFWRLLSEGIDAVGPVPSSRFDADALYSAEPATPGRIGTRWGGFLDGIEGFDADFFGVSPREAERLDPQQRLILETSWEALEDGGLVPEALADTQTGVFVGMWINEYEARLFRDPRAIDFHMTIGSGRYSASGRLSYTFGFRGPSLTVDTGCSASLVAVHLACQSLWSGETGLALAAGVNLILEPNITIAYSQSRMMAPDGRCKFGDARGDGYVRSEGAGVVVLKPLSQALAAGDHVYATIIGSAVNNDGRSSGFLTTPGAGGQEEMLRLAYRNAGIPPGRASYVEAHGTGTRAGDPVEIRAIGTVLAEGRAPGDVCRLGSVKTNIGHTEGAAGVAGLIKVALSLRHRTLPPSLHFQTGNPEIPWDTLPVRIQRALEPWPESASPAVAGVSSFGIAGTNAHVVLQAAPEPATPAATATRARAPRILPISARTPEALDESIRRMHAFVVDPASEIPGVDDLCWTASARRTHHEQRLAIVAGTRDDLVAQLEAARVGDAAAGVFRGRAESGRSNKIVFVFPGQGSQWTGMGRELLASEPAFRAALEACDAAVRVEAGFSIIEQLLADDSSSRMREIDVIQPVLFSIEVALAALWRARGFEPAAVVGHSMGEVAAACVAGALSLEDAAAVICRRSALLRRTSGHGAMAVVELTIGEAHQALAGGEDRLSVAVSNSSRSTVISGDPAALEALIAELESREVFCRRVKVDVASHSPQMDPLRPDLLAALQGLAPAAGHVPIYSTVLAEPINGAGLDAAYWTSNLRSPVLFSAAVQKLIADGHDTFIEMSPHPILIPALEEGIKDAGRSGLVAVPSLRRDEDEQRSLMNSLATLHVAGQPVVWEKLYAAPGRHVRLPSYPWQRERYWYEAVSQLDLVSGDGARARTSEAGHPLLRRRVEAADRPGARVWELALGRFASAYLLDHRIGGVALLGASAYIELFLAAAIEMGFVRPVAIAGLEFERPLRVPDGDSETLVQIVAIPEGPRAASVRLFSRTEGDWQLHASGRIEPAAAGERPIQPDAATACAVLEREAAYDDLRLGGVDIGVSLQTIATGWREGNHAGARLELPTASAHEIASYVAHPALLDGALQLTALGSTESEREVLFPAGIDRVTLRAPFESAMRASVTFDASRPEAMRADVSVSAGSGAAALVIEGLRLVKLEQSIAREKRAGECLFDLIWQPAAVAPPVPGDEQRFSGTWLVLDDGRSTGDAVATILGQRGASARVLAPSELPAAVESATPADLAGVVCILGDAAASASPADGAIAAADQVLSLFGTVPRHVRVWLVTRGAQALAEADSVSVSQAAAWGLGRAFAEEHPETLGGLVDIDPGDTPEAAAAAIVRALSAKDGEDEVVFRGDVRLVPRLRRADVGDGSAPSLYPDATYLIAGGLGDLGLQVADWMIAHGARRLILASRTPLPQRREWTRIHPAPVAARIEAIRRLEAQGAAIHVASVDVAVQSQLADFLDGFAAEGWPAIRGLVQCAGVVDGRLLADLDRDALNAVLRPKVVGTWNLHELTRDLPLDFFIMFSSIAALLPSAGQASYAAANAFLDALAHDRRRSKRPALSINWGPWAEIGMAAAIDEGSRLAARGIEPLRPRDALAAFGRAFASAGPQAVVMALDARRCGIDGHPVPALLANIVAAHREDAGANTQEHAAALRDLLAAADSFEERRSILETLLQEQVGAVLKRPASRIELTRPLRGMGLESLMALELRNRLEAATQTRLPATLAWNHPTIELLARFIASKMGVDIAPANPRFGEAPGGAGPGVSASEDTDVEDLLSEIEAMSEDDVRRVMGGDL
jgi:myxalamid-type polyketide synthase MxaE and MxaD